MIVQNSPHDGHTDISFLVPKDELARLEPVAGKVAGDIGAAATETDDGVAKVSLVGAGIKSHPTVVAEMFEALADEGINIEMITTTSIRISCIIRAEDEERAVRAVHKRFGLGGKGGQLRSHD
jgi:aspartate kinase